MRYSTEKIGTTSTEQIEAFLSKKLELPVTLANKEVYRSLTASHTHYTVIMKGYAVYQSKVIVKESEEEIKITYPNLLLYKLDNLINFSSKVDDQFNPDEVEHAEVVWHAQNGVLKLSKLYRTHANHELKEQLYDSKGALIETVNLTLHNKPDTLVYTNVYKPDPISASGQAYESPFIDNNNITNDSLNAWLVEDSIRMKWDETQLDWVLESEYALALDISAPTHTPPTLSSSNLLSTRDHMDFEYFNAYYHIHQMQFHLQSMGFELVNYPLSFDAHGSEGDQSSFIPSSVTPYILFGDGGVDDAEDADVIIHEYGHAISHSASPNTNYGSERNALDEGIGDYLALSYSHRLTGEQEFEIFNWDGHNEFWDGRSVSLTRTYPSDLERDIYSDGILFTSALQQIASKIGWEITDQILINSLYDYFPNMLLSDGASAFMESNEQLRQDADKEDMELIFCLYGLLPHCADTLPSDLPISEIYLGNTQEFAFNGGLLRIFPNGNSLSHITVFDVSGKLLHETSFDREGCLFYDLDLSHIYAPILILQIDNQTFKLLKID